MPTKTEREMARYDAHIRICGAQGGPAQKRVTLADGSTVMLPDDAVVHPIIVTEKDAEDSLRRPLGGTWK